MLNHIYINLNNFFYQKNHRSRDDKKEEIKEKGLINKELEKIKKKKFKKKQKKEFLDKKLERKEKDKIKEKDKE